jgi:hypothetical protein
MKYIVFKTGNPHESMFAAAMCSAETVKGISINYDGLKRVDGNKVELDFKLIREKMKHGVKNATQVDDGVEELKTEGAKNNKVQVQAQAQVQEDEYFIFPNIVAKNVSSEFKVTEIDNLMNTLNGAMVSPNIAPYAIELLKNAETIFMGAQDDPELVPEEFVNDSNLVFIVFNNIFKNALNAQDTLSRCFCMGIGKLNLIKRLVEIYPTIHLGDFIFYKSYEFVNYAISRDLEAGKKVAVYRDNTGDTNGEKPSIILYIFADEVPTEFSGLEFTESFDQLVGKKCKIATVQMSFWANAMKGSTR